MLAKMDEAGRARLLAALPGLKERAKTLVELKASAAFLFAMPALEEKARKILDDGGRAVLAQVRPVLEAASVWTAPALEEAMKGFAQASGLKLGAIAQPLRAALTGSTTSPGIFDVLAVLGRTESLARIAAQAR
jgi:glutamyl-tRNA synthetase